MSVLTPLRNLRNAYYGPTLNRAAAVLPATGSQTLFTVTGGRVLITSLVGEVTTAASATATTITVEAVAGANTSALNTATAITSAALGTLFCPSAVGAPAQVGAAVTQNNEVAVQAGSIRITTSATNTGAMRWTLNYIPIDDGASVSVA